MNQPGDDDQVERMDLVMKIDKEEKIIRDYAEAIQFYRHRVYRYQRLLGRIEGRLGDEGEL